MALEDELRQLFAARAEIARVPEDPAGRAIRRARTVQRRRTIGSGVAAALVAVLVLGGAVSLQVRFHGNTDIVTLGPLMVPGSDPPAPTTSPASVPAATVAPAAPHAQPASEGWRLKLIGLDLRVEQQLWSVSGRRYRLTGVGEVTRVYRVPAGWVYGGAEQVRLLRQDGTTVALGSFGPRWVVSPDGGRVAYVRGDRLAVYRIARRGLTGGVAAIVPEQAQPIAFAGTHVIIWGGADGQFGSLSSTDLSPTDLSPTDLSSADPRAAEVSAARSAEPAWNKALMNVYGATDERVAGLIVEDGGAMCLAALDVSKEGLEVTDRGSCRPEGSDDPGAVLAPGGRWLARPDANGTSLVELDRALVDQETAVSCPVISKVPPVWVDAQTLATADDSHVVRCRTDGAAEYVPLPEGLAADWEFVPDLEPASPAGR